MRTTILTLLAFATADVLAAPHSRTRPSSTYRPQHYGSPGVNSQRAKAVVDAFRFAWDGYYTNCFGHDELHPVSNTCGDSR